MAIELTEEARRAAEQNEIRPNLAVEIEGYSEIFGVAALKRAIVIGDVFNGVPLKIGVPFGNDPSVWRIGGYVDLDNQKAYISLDQGTTTRISQQLQPDRGQGTGVSRMSLTLVDKDGEVSRLLSPGLEVVDIIGRKITVRFGFAETKYPESYNVVFKGLIEGFDSGAGVVELLFNHIEDRKRSAILTKEETETTGALGTGDTTIPVLDTVNFFLPYTGHPAFPSGDPDLTFFAKIEDEIVSYTGKTSTTLTGVGRGALGTVAAAHDSGTNINPLWNLTGLGIDIALKIMLSGKNGPYKTGVAVRNFVRVSLTETFSEVIFFKEDVAKNYSVIPGSYATTTGAVNGANNKTDIIVSEVVKTNDGTYIRFGGETFVEENGSPATISFRSAYDTLGLGLSLDPEEVDTPQHETIRDRFLGNFLQDHRVEAIENTKNFLDIEVYKPMACFAVPREGKASVVFHSPPLPSSKIKTLSKDNIKDPDDIKTSRAMSDFFVNTIIYELDYDAVTGKFATTLKFKDSAAEAQIGQGEKTLKISAKGLRTASGGVTSATNASNRLLARYRIGSQFFKNIKILYGVGYNMELGDIVLLDTDSLNVTNFETGDRTGKLALYETHNKQLNVSSGEVVLTLVDTSFGLDKRYATWGPASKIDTNSTTTRLNLKRSFGTKSFEIEGNKWTNFVGERIRVRSDDYSVSGESTIQSIFDGPTGTSITLGTALGFTPLVDYVLEQPPYPASTDDQVDAKWKLLHPFFSPTKAVVSGADDFNFDVGAGDVGRFFIGATVLIHNASWSVKSPEVKVTNIAGTTITVGATLTFTPVAGYSIEFIGFPDEGGAYRWI